MLPEQFRMTVLLADVQGCSYREIAKLAGVPLGTVMSRLHRGRRALSKQLWLLAKEGSARGEPRRRGQRAAARPQRHRSAASSTTKPRLGALRQEPSTHVQEERIAP